MALHQVWRTIKKVKIESLGANIFMFKFADEANKRRVNGRRPLALRLGLNYPYRTERN